MSSLSYKTYQQVISLPNSKANTKVTPAPVKRRTKSGCLTCRKRKKKCDEDVAGGKCQGCTRNFLECCWPEATAKKSAPAATAAAATDLAVASTPVELPITPKQTPQSSPRLSMATKPESPSSKAKAYPSPEMSPVFEGKEEQSEISTLELPKAHFKVTKPKKQVEKKQLAKNLNNFQTKFVITSVEKRRLVHIK
ncbi:hypothetical protein CLIB1423_21S00914 [[Candida] railenensis]|uniref:Zn(2)-C6 fungal-type domain-containing protein n=1 Tax=[Candida] railenensis TaxID=45579 RepID=A0A9P0QV00_9ASCO|nr:hypothetical protein CLIB1423_21S00914 [[Candida] railenensis]